MSPNHAVETKPFPLTDRVYGLVSVLVGFFFGSLLVFSASQTLAATLSAEPSAAQPHMDQALKSFQRGDFEQAVLSWTEAARLYEAEQKPKEQSNALIHAAQSYQALGQYKEALKNLESSLALAEKLGDRTQTAVALGALGNVYIAAGPPEMALKYLNEGLRIAREVNNQDLSALILNNLGNLLTAQKKYSEALVAYRESVSLAAARNNRALLIGALVNEATASIQMNQPRYAKALLDRALDQIRALEASHEKAVGLINIGLAYDDLRSRLPDSNDSLLLLSHETLSEAGTLSDSIGDRRTSSYAWGSLGKLYEDERRYQEALQLTRRATFAAQQINAPESLYRWEWQTGRLLTKLGIIDDAIGAYRRAVRTLQSIRPELSVSYGA